MVECRTSISSIVGKRKNGKEVNQTKTRNQRSCIRKEATVKKKAVKRSPDAWLQYTLRENLWFILLDHLKANSLFDINANKWVNDRTTTFRNRLFTFKIFWNIVAIPGEVWVLIATKFWRSIVFPWFKCSQECV